jgi:hypothetical protein
MNALSSRRPEDQEHSRTGSLDVPSDAHSSPGSAGHEAGRPTDRDGTSQPPDSTGDDDWVPL